MSEDKKAPFVAVEIRPALEGRGAVIITLGNGFSLVAELDRLPEDIYKLYALHGVNQKLRDSTAGHSKEENYAAAQAEIESVWEASIEGSWTRKQSARLTVNFEDLVHAVAKVKRLSLEDAKLALEESKKARGVEGFTKHYRKVLAENADLKAAVLTAQTERAKAEAKAKPSKTWEL